MNKSSIGAKIATITVCLLGFSFAAFAQSPPMVGVLTQHYDYWRSGSNASEVTLTPSSISSDNFGVIATVNNLADIVEVQPLVVPNVQITCLPNQTIVTCQTGLSTGQFEVAYVAAANTIYAINAVNGQILLQRDFGAEGSCHGIRATPVIYNNILYAITVTDVNGANITTLNAIRIGTLTDAIAPYTVTATNTFHALTDGTPYSFHVDESCPRTALLSLGGNIYAGFRGTESVSGTTRMSGNTRGWLLGWNAATLAPLPPLLTDLQATSTNSFFLSSIWMSGSGIASDGTNLYFSTGNSDPSGTSYSFPNNIEESVVKVNQSLKVTSIFTPSNYATLDAADTDFGSGGVIVIPTHGTPMVVAAGKDGRMFLLDSANLGGYTPGGPDKVLNMQNIGGCWCAPSFFPGPDGIIRVVSSGGNSVMTWKIVTASASATPQFIQEAVGQIAPAAKDPGFFTTVSSNGDGADPSRIIWAVGRPTYNTTNLVLYAFDAVPVNGTLPLLGQYVAGTWGAKGDAYIVPVVANGEVFVAGGSGTGAGTLTIFGLDSAPSGG